MSALHAKIKDDPRFSKYFRMLKVGVPMAQVRGTFQTETGCDPDLLENPDGPAPA